MITDNDTSADVLIPNERAARTVCENIHDQPEGVTIVFRCGRQYKQLAPGSGAGIKKYLLPVSNMWSDYDYCAVSYARSKHITLELFGRGGSCDLSDGPDAANLVTHDTTLYAGCRTHVIPLYAEGTQFVLAWSMGADDTDPPIIYAMHDGDFTTSSWSLRAMCKGLLAKGVGLIASAIVCVLAYQYAYGQKEPIYYDFTK